jgi:predicted dehydrogenase/nucleoside-diphosphate-sugar epimerase
MNSSASPAQPISQEKKVTVSDAHRRRNATRRVGLLGTGYIAEWHAKAISTTPGIDLVAVCDLAATRARAFAEKFGAPRVYSALEAMLVEEDLDAVHVLIPPDLHFDAARTTLTAGVDVLLEKPMCSSVEDCETLMRLADQLGRRIAVSHNFLFCDAYQRLRKDLKDGLLGKIDYLRINWQRELSQVTHGPYDIWMLRDPSNITLETGPHLASQILDLVGWPDDLHVEASNPIDLPNGRKFFRRWQISGCNRGAAIELGFSFVRGFPEYTIHARGSLGSATVDFDRDTYTLMRQHPLSEDFNRYSIVVSQARSLKIQARKTLLNYLLAKIHLRSAVGGPYGESIANAIRAFYSPHPLPQGISAKAGAEVIRLCDEIGRAAHLPTEKAPAVTQVDSHTTSSPRILVLGGTGFIGQELVRQLVEAGHEIRLLVREPAKLDADLRGRKVELRRGDLNNEANLRQALFGIDYVYHLARSNVKTWAEYERFEIGTTQQIAETALAAGVKRFIYTGTIDCYYAGSRSGRITEDTGLDPHIERRNLYARAKAASEQILLAMHHERGLPLVIVRPGIVIGRGGSPFHWGVGMWWYDSVCELWGNGRQKLPIVLVEDVARGLVAALDAPSIEGRSFNLVADPCLSAQEYLDALDRCGGIKIQRYPTSILRFYLTDMFKWAVKVIVRHPERRLPSYRDWETRTNCGTYDCTAAKTDLQWRPVSNLGEIIDRGIRTPLEQLIR